MRISGTPFGVEGRFNYSHRFCGDNIRTMTGHCYLSKKDFMPDLGAL